MAGAIGMRGDYTGAALRRLARRCSDADQVRRLLSLAVILDGGGIADVALELAVLALFAAVLATVGSLLFNEEKRRTTWA